MVTTIIDELVSRNIIRSQLLDHVLSVYNNKFKFSHPFITISREAGSGGRLIGQKVAKQLRYDFYDDRILDEIAKITKTKKYYLKAVDEKQHRLFKDLIQSILNVNYVDPLVYQQNLIKVIVKRAKQGKVVFLGRGANFITPRNTGLHVRVTAPFYYRVQNTVKYEGLDYAYALKLVSKLDKQRRGFIRDVFGKDIRKAKYYDLVLSTETLTINQAVEIIVTAFKVKFKRVIYR